ncbi:MAG: MmcQ/YjbR family DNA-binding protein [Devosia sp.]
MAKTAAEKSFDRLVRLAKKLKLDEVVAGTTYDSAPALRVRNRPFVSIKEAEIMVLHCPLEVKEMLMEMAPHIYFQTPHFEGWPGLMVRLDLIDDEELAIRIENAWRFKAPKTLAAKRPTAG